MRNMLLVCALTLAPIISFAQTFTNPTLDINGVTHFLADSDDTTGEWFDTADGFCVRQGFQGMAQAAGMQASQAPLVRLDRAGAVVETFADTKDGRLWVIIEVVCN